MLCSFLTLYILLELEDFDRLKGESVAVFDLKALKHWNRLIGHYLAELKYNCRVPTAPGKPGKMVTVFPAWKNPGILSFLPNVLEK